MPRLAPSKPRPPTNDARANPAHRPSPIERSWRDSAWRYRELFANANDAILVYDPRRLTILEANRRAVKLYGYRRRELVGMSLARIAADIAVERRKIRAVLARQRVASFETVRLRADGARIHVAANIAVVRHGGRPVILSISRDITLQKAAERRLRESERRLRAAMEASLDAVYVHECVRDAQGRIVDFRFLDLNRRGAKLLRRTREALIGAQLCELYPAARTGGFFAKFVQVVETGIPLVEEFPVDSPNVNARWLHQQVVATSNGVAITARDVTEQKRIEEKLKALPRRILEAQEAERRRVARELHDSVGQILSSVRFRLQTLEERLPAKGAALRAEAARARAALESAQLEVRRIAHHLRPSELDDLGLIPALRAIGVEFRLRSGVALALRCARNGRRLPRDVEEALYRIVQEALGNIERHARARRVELSLQCGRQGVRLRIHDDGRGFIPSNTRPGLGLVNMRERAASAGGALQIRSAPAQGTTLVVEIPARPAGPRAAHG